MTVLVNNCPFAALSMGALVGVASPPVLPGAAVGAAVGAAAQDPAPTVNSIALD